MADFVIPLRRRWPLLVLAFLAVVYFVLVVALIATDNHLKGVSNDTLAFIGVGIFVVLALVMFLYALRRRGPGPAPIAERTLQDEPAEAIAAAPKARYHADEYLVTPEAQQGLKVLEYSAPAKSRHHGAVYAKAYVPVTKEHVLRVETLAAEGAEI